MTEIQEKIANYQEKIARLELQIQNEDATDIFGRIGITELKREIQDCEKRIAKLQARMNGTDDKGPTDEQLRAAAYVFSADYDND